MLKKAFTLIELLIVVAIIGIIVVAVAIALNPSQRIVDAQTASLRAQVAAVGQALSVCMNYYNAGTGTVNGYTNCSSLDLLAAATTPGGPFLSSTPTGTWGFDASGTAPTNLNGCVFSTASISGSTVYAQFQSAVNAVTAPPLPVKGAGDPACQ